MSNTIGILLLVAIGLVFIPTSVAAVFSTMFLKAIVVQFQQFEKRIDGVEYKLQQIPLPVETDIARSEMDYDEEYHIPPIPNSRETNSNGIPIVRRETSNFE